MMTYYGQSVHLLSIIKQIIPRKSFFTKEQKHGLEEAGEQVHQIIFQWLVEHL
jgi:hypothetical protein